MNQEPPKKKRGRRKKSEMNQEEETQPKIPKKRGRKPKGGKISSKQSTESNENATPENVIIASSSYELFRVSDNLKVVPFGTGSDLHTVLSHDVSGNYFDLDMSLLEADYMYEIRLSYYNDSINSWQEQPQTFKFRVEE